MFAEMISSRTAFHIYFSVCVKANFSSAKTKIWLDSAVTTKVLSCKQYGTDYYLERI